VAPLIPYLRSVGSFAEPCCGDGTLVRHLESYGLRCICQGDISAGQDALAIDTYGGADSVITNPPWTRKPLHPLIRHLQLIAPTWLLLDQDWSGTKQAAPYLMSCSDILPIGRQIWIPGTTMHGKDNAAWYRFDAGHAAGPIFHPFRSAPVSSRATLCRHCRQAYEPQRSSSRFCTQTCKQRAYRRRLSVTVSVTPDADFTHE
jgi:hypothetical protein